MALADGDAGGSALDAGAAVRSADPRHAAQIGDEWTEHASDGTAARYRRVQRSDGRQQIQVYRPDLSRWIFGTPPSLTPHPETLRKKKRRGVANRGKGVAGLSDLSEEDRLRIKLRDVKRKIAPGTAPTKLGTLPGVHGFSFATRYIDGGRERVIEFIQLAVLERQPAAERFYAVFADLSKYERSIVSFDDVCSAAGIKPSELLTQIVAVQMEYGRDVGNLVAAMTHPEVIAKMAKSASRIDGEHAELSQRDRFEFLRGRGFLPLPKGATIVNVHASATAQAAAASAAEPSVPSFADDLSFVRPSQRQIIEADPDTAPVTAPTPATAEPVYVRPSDDES